MLDNKVPNWKLKHERERRGLSQQRLAEILGTSFENISRWERGITSPQPHFREKLCKLFKKDAAELGLISQEVGSEEIKPLLESVPVQETLASSHTISSPHRLPSHPTLFGPPEKMDSDVASQERKRTPKEDWAEAPTVRQMYGREEELKTLQQWILNDHVHLAALVGIGGIGKTTLAVEVTDAVKNAFDFVFWRSLHNAPPLNRLLQDCIKFVSDQQRMDLPGDTDDQISLLMSYLRERRCLLIVDNFETILQSGKGVGSYREGYEGYGKLLQHVSESKHVSCLLLTSREKPHEVALGEGNSSPVRSHRLAGLGPGDGRAILRDKGLHGEDDTWEDLVNHYGGNPLSLKLVSQFIVEVFEGDIAGFLRDGTTLFSDIQGVLDQQFERLSVLEQEMMYWLAIERESVTLNALERNFVHFVSKRNLQEAFRSLRRRSLVETSTAGISLQNVVTEYLTERFIDSVCEEVSAGTLSLFESYALMKAQTKDYIRESQIRLILHPVAQWLLDTFQKEGIAKALMSIISSQRNVSLEQSNYVAGNVLNLLIHLGYDLRGYDFSHLTVRQAYLQGAMLSEMNFAYAHFVASVFTDTFGSILSIAHSSNENLLAAGTSNSEVRLWQIASGTPIRTFRKHKDWVRSVAFSPDGTTLASCSNDQTIVLWEVSSGRCLMELHGHINRVWSIAFSPDGNTLASGGDDQIVRVWDVNSGQCIKEFWGNTARINSIAFSSDGDIIVSGGEDQALYVWDVNSGQLLQTLRGHTGWIRSIALSPHGSTLASGGSDQTIRLWDMNSGQCIKVLQGHTGWIYSVSFNPDGNTIVSGSSDKTVRLWDVSSCRCLKVLQGHSGWVRSTIFTQDGNTVVSGGEDQSMRLWEASSGRCLRILQGYSKRVHSVAFSPDGKIVATGGDDLCAWEVDSGQRLQMMRGHSSWIYSVSFSPDGKILASSGSDHTIRLWEVSSGQCLKVLQGHNKCVWSIAFSPDASILASCSNDQTLRLWEVSSGRCFKVLEGHIGWIYSVVFSQDGSMLASSGDDEIIRVWEVSSGRCLMELHGHVNRVWSIAFSPDGTILASGGDDQMIRVWDVSSGLLLQTLRGHTGWIRSVAFSPDGNTLASGGEDQNVHLWDLSTGQCFKVLEGHRSSVWSVAFGDAGNNVASASDDGTTRLWNRQTWECIKILRNDKPYDGMNMTGITGVTEVQKATFKTLGAYEEAEKKQMTG
jgi:WD40 repeat protein/transcriptional regulator with XRE-family HTH domain